MTRGLKNVRVVEVPMSAWMLLPARAGTCAWCATEHEPELPHNRFSIYWGIKFKLAHGRDPTPDDAMAHCSAEVRAAWLEAEARAGVRREP